MGRTTPTYRDALRGLEAEWEPMRRALRREYQADFDRLFDHARGFADAAGYANPPDPERAFVLSLLLAHEVELRRLRAALSALEGATVPAEADRPRSTRSEEATEAGPTDERVKPGSTEGRAEPALTGREVDVAPTDEGPPSSGPEP